MHIPVLQKEVLEYLNPKTNQNFIDCTLGEGGHSLAILEKTNPQGKILAIDFDPQMIERIKTKFQKCFKANGWKKERVIFVCDSFANLKKIIEKNNFKPNGILLDLGISSWHLEESNKGFSFRGRETLDMRYNPEVTDLDAKGIVNTFSQREIEKILKDYGEEKFAKRIATRIVEERKKELIETTYQLVKIIEKVTPSRCQYIKPHFATRTFQALRIAVNKELDNLEKVLPQALEILEPSGRLAIISFHSLEDRIIKNFFNKQAKEGLLKILTKKPIIPNKEEVEVNPRSRSAKLRAIEKNK